MRHGLFYRKLNRKTSHRKSMLKNLCTQLIENKQIITTLERAKELRKVIEPLVTLAKENTLHHRRMAARKLFSKDALNVLFADIGPMYLNRPGGYTQVLKLGYRPGDNARQAIIRFVSNPINSIEQQNSEIKA